MSKLYEASGLSTAPAATADKLYAQIWNAYTTRQIWLRELGFTNTVGTTCKVALKRTTARGTNTTTQAGTDRESTGTSTATLDLTYSADPTVTGNYLRRTNLAGVVGAGGMWTWWTGAGLAIPSATGLGIVVPTAVVGQVLELWVVWEE